MGATYDFLSKPEHVARVVRPHQFDEVFEFMLHYYELRLKIKPHSAWRKHAATQPAQTWWVGLCRCGMRAAIRRSQENQISPRRSMTAGSRAECIEHAIIEHCQRPSLISDCRDPRSTGIQGSAITVKDLDAIGRGSNVRFGKDLPGCLNLGVRGTLPQRARGTSSGVSCRALRFAAVT